MDAQFHDASRSILACVALLACGLYHHGYGTGEETGGGPGVSAFDWKAEGAVKGLR